MKYGACVAAVGLLLSACGGEEAEFIELDAEGLADVLDAGMTEESGLKGQITDDLFTETDVAEFNTLAEEACVDLADGISADDYAEFSAGVGEGAVGLEDLIDAEALAVAMIRAACPSYVDNLQTAIDG